MGRMPRQVLEIVNEQVVRWQDDARERRLRDQRTLPVVTVSRQHGAHGAEVAQEVARRLGFMYWHREILHEIAEDAHVAERLLASFDEHRRGAIADLVQAAFVNVSASSYLRSLAKVVHTIAAHGGAVIVGRGAQYYLKPETVLRVRTVCPPEKRVRNLVARGVPEAQARAEVEATDRDRRDFVRDVFHRDVDDPLDYDLVVNLENLSVERAADVVVAAYQARFEPRAAQG